MSRTDNLGIPQVAAPQALPQSNSPGPTPQPNQEAGLVPTSNRAQTTAASASGQENSLRPDGPGGNLPAAATSLDAAKALPDPGVAVRGGMSTVQTPEEADEFRDLAKPKKEKEPIPAKPIPTHDEMKEIGFTPLDAHPPLRENDFIQGPHDRKNRRPTKKELEHGRLVNEGVIKVNEITELSLDQDPPEVKDPPVDHASPKDVPADPTKVAESRGIKLRRNPKEVENLQEQPA